jgi:DNA-binding transcriptional ArsR family regulator
MSIAPDFAYYLGESTLPAPARIILAVMKVRALADDSPFTASEIESSTGMSRGQVRAAMTALRSAGYVDRYRHATVEHGEGGDRVTTITRYTLT